MTSDPLSQNIQATEIASIINAIDRGIFVTNEAGICTYINNTALELLGYKRENCIGQKMHSLIHFKYKNGESYREKDCFICKAKPLILDTDLPEDEVFWKANGSWFYINYSSNAIIEGGTFKGTVVTFTDITEQKVRETAIVESESRYKYIFENNPSPMCIWDFETLMIVECNAEILNKYGYTREEFLKLNIREVRPPEDIDLINAATENESVYGEVHKRVWRHKKKNGELMNVEVIGHLITFNGRKASLVIINDVTDKIRAEFELKTSEEKLRTATQIAMLGYWQKDIAGNNHYWSDELYNIWGVSRANFELNQESFFERVHPQDKQYFINEQAAMISGREEINFQYRIILPNGDIKWLQEIGKIVNDENGKPLIFRGTVQDITEQKLLSLSLEESNLRYDLVTQATSDAIWDWDILKGTIYLGGGYQRIFGHETTGLNESVRNFTDLLHPEDKAAVIRGIYKVVEGKGTNWYDEYRYLKADGIYAYVEDRGFVIRDDTGRAVRMVGAMQDITQHKHEEQRLKLLESVVTNTNDAILITEAEPVGEPGPRIIYINNAFAEMTGYTEEEIIGKTPRILQGPKSDQKELKRLSRALHEYQPCEITTINYKKNGEEFWVNFSVSPVADQTGRVTHFIAIERDVSERKKAENELKLFTEDLFKRNKELQQFGYIISHNLRSPVANIMGIANLLELDKDDPDTVDLCTRSLKTSINSLDGVIKDLSKILSITDGSADLIKETVNLSELIDSITTDIKPIIDHAGAVVENNTAQIIVNLHKAYLYSIFINLISNSIKYKSACTPIIKVSAFEQDQRIIIKVEDNGIGIDLEKHREDLFKPYKRFETSVEGKGLGLFLIKSHVEALNGKLELESELGKGTTFTIIFPGQ